MSLGVPFVVGNVSSLEAAQDLATKATGSLKLTPQALEIWGYFIDQVKQGRGYTGWNRGEIELELERRHPGYKANHGPTARVKKLIDLGIIRESGRRRVNPKSGRPVGVLILGDGRHHLSRGALCADRSLRLSRRRGINGENMSLTSLENDIMWAARRAFNNPRLRKKDLLEWSSGPLSPESDNEVALKLEEPPTVWVTVPKECDKRKVN